MKPAPQRCTLLEFFDIAEGLQKRFLHAVARVFFVSHQPPGDGQHAPPIGAHELLVTGVIADPQSRDQLPLI